MLDCLDAPEMYNLKLLSNKMRGLVEDIDVFEKLKIRGEWFMQYAWLSFTEIKQVHPPIQVANYLQHEERRLTTTIKIDLPYETREVHCNQASDWQAYGIKPVVRPVVTPSPLVLSVSSTRRIGRQSASVRALRQCTNVHFNGRWTC